MRRSGFEWFRVAAATWSLTAAPPPTLRNLYRCDQAPGPYLTTLTPLPEIWRSTQVWLLRLFFSTNQFF